jgi:hypothetical protein
MRGRAEGLAVAVTHADGTIAKPGRGRVGASDAVHAIVSARAGVKTLGRRARPAGRADRVVLPARAIRVGAGHLGEGGLAGW